MHAHHLLLLPCFCYLFDVCLPAPAAADVLAEAAANVTLVGDAAFTVVTGGRARARLVGPRANETGGAWAARAVPVRAAFAVEFNVTVSEPSHSCARLHESYAACRARGGHGFALVLHTQGAAALGAGAEGLGYAGLGPALALEFDSHYDASLSDPYDAHVALLADRERLSADHARAGLGRVWRAPDVFADGLPHAVRVAYAPALDPALLHPDLCAATGTCGLLASAPHLADVLRDGASGVGALSVAVDGAAPLSVLPVKLDDLLGADDATVGFTAATGSDAWQAVDIGAWRLCLGDGPCEPVLL